MLFCVYLLIHVINDIAGITEYSFNTYIPNGPKMEENDSFY